MAQKRKPAGVSGEFGKKWEYGVKVNNQSALCVFQWADVDKIVRDHTEFNPALHPLLAFESAAIESMFPFDYADPLLASGPALLATLRLA